MALDRAVHELFILLSLPSNQIAALYRSERAICKPFIKVFHTQNPSIAKPKRWGATVVQGLSIRAIGGATRLKG